MKGKIIINAFLRPKESVLQANRLKEEFNKLGVEIEIVSDGFLRSMLVGDKIVTDLFDTDFCVFLDKDKYLSESLERAGVRLFNNHDAIRVCDDKGRTCIVLSNNGVKIPDTVFGFLSYSTEDIIPNNFVDQVINKLSLPVVVKESFGSMGKGVHLATTKDQLVSLMEKLKNTPHIYQKYIDYRVGTDVRLIVIGKKVCAVMERHNDIDFRSNVGQGGYGKKIDCDREFIKTAEKCAEILGLDYCGVDLLYGKDGPVVCEVNSNAFFNEAEKVTGVNIASLYANYIIESVKNKV